MDWNQLSIQQRVWRLVQIGMNQKYIPKYSKIHWEQLQPFIQQRLEKATMIIPLVNPLTPEETEGVRELWRKQWRLAEEDKKLGNMDDAHHNEGRAMAYEQIINLYGTPQKGNPELCQCSDAHCPVHKGLRICRKKATTILYRIDMMDESGTPMCDKCAEDALSSGVFREENPASLLIPLLASQLQQRNPLSGIWTCNRFGHIELNWDDGRELYLQSEGDVNQFLRDIGLNPDDVGPGDFDNIPHSISSDYWNVASFKQKNPQISYTFMLGVKKKIAVIEVVRTGNEWVVHLISGLDTYRGPWHFPSLWRKWMIVDKLKEYYDYVREINTEYEKNPSALDRLIEQFGHGATGGHAGALSIREDYLYTYAEPIARRVGSWIFIKERSSYGSVTSNRHVYNARKILEREGTYQIKLVPPNFDLTTDVFSLSLLVQRDKSEADLRNYDEINPCPNPSLTQVKCPRCGNTVFVRQGWTAFTCFKCDYLIDKERIEDEKDRTFVPGTPPSKMEKKMIEKNPSEKEMEVGAEVYKTFHDFAPEVLETVKIPQPKILVKIGTGPTALGYFSSKWKNSKNLNQTRGRKRGQHYIHRFEDEDKDGIVAFAPDLDWPNEGLLVAWRRAKISADGIDG